MLHTSVRSYAPAGAFRSSDSDTSNPMYSTAGRADGAATGGGPSPRRVREFPAPGTAERAIEVLSPGQLIALRQRARITRMLLGRQGHRGDTERPSACWLELAPELPKGARQDLMDVGQRESGDLGDLRPAEIAAEPQCHQLALALAERPQRIVELWRDPELAAARSRRPPARAVPPAAASPHASRHPDGSGRPGGCWAIESSHVFADARDGSKRPQAPSARTKVCWVRSSHASREESR